MKIVLSLPDALSTATDALAQRLGLSRSRLVATALAEFVARHEDRKITERLDPRLMRQVEQGVRLVLGLQV